MPFSCLNLIGIFLETCHVAAIVFLLNPIIVPTRNYYNLISVISKIFRGNETKISQTCNVLCCFTQYFIVKCMFVVYTQRTHKFYFHRIFLEFSPNFFSVNEWETKRIVNNLSAIRFTYIELERQQRTTATIDRKQSRRLRLLQ